MRFTTPLVFPFYGFIDTVVAFSIILFQRVTIADLTASVIDRNPIKNNNNGVTGTDRHRISNNL